MITLFDPYSIKDSPGPPREELRFVFALVFVDIFLIQFQLPVFSLELQNAEVCDGAKDTTRATEA
jgi:hypothetical protein